MFRTSLILAFLITGGFLPLIAQADIQFSFDNGDPKIDGTDVGDSVTVGGLTLTIRGFDYPDLSGVELVTDAQGVAVATNTEPGTIISAAGTFQGDGPGFGVNNLTIAETAFDVAYGPGNEQNRFNFDESFIFDFSDDVTFDLIDFNLLSGTVEFFNVAFDGNSFDFFNSTTDGSDAALNPFGSTVISAGTDIRLTFRGDQDDTGALQALVVNNVSAVPEPSSMSLVAIAGIGMFQRRRRRAIVSA